MAKEASKMMVLALKENMLVDTFLIVWFEELVN